MEIQPELAMEMNSGTAFITSIKPEEAGKKS
jgi:hypothetical protein